ncbi:Bni4p [Lachancea thermotolerans CBS 6340]|uniref:KLTH0B08448p n=1 Tax=Lachancea thermotolerans (strain ATCC 56472 / CBS 6340 / NRRL Y-8284) TaxID=559295 RepID=C5DD56_LACTC|nr:KLTH0B08448p [Lachancea thermotolerans CBS 6340]CAR21717.1 KLTH0B08448p [Lachancea thermotolerans CBS 6340]
MNQSLEEANNDGESYLNDTFYSSTSTDNLEHARTFRNSVLMQDMSGEKPYNPEQEQIPSDPSDTQGKQYLKSNTNDANDRETETKTLTVTASPSLSALAGILNEKAIQAEKKMRSSMILDNSIQESIPEEEHSVHNSPVLIDIDGTSDGSYRLKFPPQMAHLQNEIEQPDFLTTPRLDPPTPRVEPADSDLPNGGQQEKPQEQVSNVSSEREIETQNSNSPKATAERADNSRPLPRKQASLRSFSGMSVGSFASNEQPLKESSSGKKRKSIFSFLKKKPRKNSSLLSQDNSSSATLPTSATFSVSKSYHENDLPASTRLTKNSPSNGSIFSTFRKNKASKKEAAAAADRTLHVPKQRATSGDSNSSNTGGASQQKRGVQTRKPTPLDFEHVSQKAPSTQHNSPILTEPSTELQNTPQLVVKSPVPSENKVPDDVGESLLKADSGGVLFPKSLSAHEVESIVSLERSRSVKSAKRNSLNSHRVSLTDNMSAKINNDGMFITEPSAPKLSTPDLTKSPTSSILRNGTFDTLESSTQRGSYAEPNNLGISSAGLRAQDRDFSFTSIEQKLNDITLDSESEDELAVNTKKASTSAGENFDTELMSDIMEFANIIDFGKDLDLNLDLSQEDINYKSLNPSDVKQSEKLPRDEMSADSFNFNSVAQVPLSSSGDRQSFSQHSYRSSIERNDTTNTDRTSFRRHSTLLSPPLNEDTRTEQMRNILSADDDDDEFEGEDFNELEEKLESQTIGSPTWQPPLDNRNRPISISFKGLRANQLNSSSNLSALRLSPSDYTVSNSHDLMSERKSVSFSSSIVLFSTYTEDEYDRHPEVATCNQLTPQLAQIIKEELNTLKAEMEVHEESRCYTHFF